MGDCVCFFCFSFRFFHFFRIFGISSLQGILYSVSPQGDREAFCLQWGLFLTVVFGSFLLTVGARLLATLPFLLAVVIFCLVENCVENT